MTSGIAQDNVREQKNILEQQERIITSLRDNGQRHAEVSARLEQTLRKFSPLVQQSTQVQVIPGLEEGKTFLIIGIYRTNLSAQ